MSDLASIFLLSLLAMFTPTLLAAVTVMMLLPNPKKLMLGYLLGAYLTSITAGLLIVFSLHGSASESTAHTLGPIEDIVVGLVALLVAFVLGSGRDAPLQERRRRRKEAKEAEGEKKESLPRTDAGPGIGSDHLRRRRSPHLSRRLLPDRARPDGEARRRRRGRRCCWSSPSA